MAEDKDAKFHINNQLYYRDTGHGNVYQNNNNFSGENVKVFVGTQLGLNSGRCDKLIGYWGSWSAWRPEELQFDTQHIDPTLFTHLVYTFFQPTIDGNIKVIDEFLGLSDLDGVPGGRGTIAKFVGLRAKNANCKMMEAVGGMDEERSKVFSEIAANQSLRQKFAANAVTFLKKFGFDGLDIHWTYPEAKDKKNLVLMLEVLYKAVKGAGFILSISVGPTRYRGNIYDIAGIAKNVDIVNLLAYELHGFWDGEAACSAPIYCGRDKNPELNVDACVRFWRSEGTPDHKLVLSISTYGKTYKLADPKKNEIYADVSGVGNTSPITGLQGTISYQELVNSAWIRKWETLQKVPYAFSGDQWVTYEDTESIKEKVKFVQSKNLGGVSFSSIEFDDFHGSSGQGTFPLINAARNALLHNS